MQQTHCDSACGTQATFPGSLSTRFKTVTDAGPEQPFTYRDLIFFCVHRFARCTSQTPRAAISFQPWRDSLYQRVVLRYYKDAFRWSRINDKSKSAAFLFNRASFYSGVFCGFEEKSGGAETYIGADCWGADNRFRKNRFRSGWYGQYHHLKANLILVIAAGVKRHHDYRKQKLFLAKVI